MLCQRIVVLILTIIFTACMTCSILFPAFRNSAKNSDGRTVRRTYYFWYTETTTSGTTTTTASTNDFAFAGTARNYVRNFECRQARALYTALSAVSVAAAGLGGIACLVLACWTTAGHNVSIGAVAAGTTFLAMACAAATVGLAAFVYTHDFCSPPSTAAKVPSPHSDAFKLVEGFGLACAATGGFLIAFIAQVVGLCRSCAPAPEKSPVRVRSAKGGGDGRYSDVDSAAARSP
ncbi:hypothetical protein NESM_000844500 [Novymonas esmeraldas]|uniref:Uncharacterized protein n=1 Tax=Novymonas esmeraldas TaxID=1808958 RepID=A0AAW0EWS0_9TRYP